ncbi:N-acetylmuramoyl-L-alanine amidase [Methylomonas sp. HYX-M1]|uniref:N-acetylmuramoyl-L-alanine amidase n=1 Tax=Methylomonas sp. HYX-M1 TaxID=3139307 RepID=UPI00345C2951
MLKQWTPCAPENFRKGRGGLTPSAVVIHAYPSLQDTDSLFANPKAGESCHYVVADDGSVHQYVDEHDTAFHAGVVVSPSWNGVRRGVNPNLHTIGVAAAVPAGAGWSDAQYASVAQLLNEIAEQWHLAMDAEHVVLHSEIRASKNCTGASFQRDKLLQLLAAQAAAAPAEFATRFVHIIKNANLRDAQPSTRARVLRTLTAGSDLEVIGFTERGERLRGNPVWYRTAEDAYLWAGLTDQPQPVKAETPLAPPAAPAKPAALADAKPAAAGGPLLSGIARIDDLRSGKNSAALSKGEAVGDGVGAIQDLLSGHGFKGMPNILASSYGNFGSKTLAAVQDFQGRQGLPAGGNVDAATLEKLLSVPAVKPCISQVYLSLVLGIAYQGMQKVLGIVAQMEGVGKFGALNLNTDKAGLSYGIIQWAQKPGRLPEILKAFSAADRELYIDIFGDGDANLADGLIAHVSRPSGGVNSNTGETTNNKFNLIARPWTDRFEKATVQPVFQTAQVQTATKVFKSSLAGIQGYAPDIRSERGIAFMLDVANQFGDGGLKKIYQQVHRAGMQEFDILEAIADETVERIADKFKHGVRARRDGFLETKRLSDKAVDVASLG